MRTVEELMTREVVTLKEDDDTTRADDLLATNHIRHLPVVRGGMLVGLVSHRDLIRAMGRQERGALPSPTLVRDIMTRAVETVGPRSSVREALHKMLDHRYGCVPVVEDGGRLVGILTETDLVRLAGRLLDQDEKR
ncbi:MAG: CBS domain-containing protein [Archangium sp.]